MAPPLSMAEAPVRLPAPRTDFGATALPSYILFAGGLDANDRPVTDVSIYDPLTHTLLDLSPLPAARAAPTVLGGQTGLLYVFGGRDDAGDPTATLWGADSKQGKSAHYSEGASDSALARAGERGERLAGDTFIVGGSPPLRIHGFRAEAWDLDALDGMVLAMLSGGARAARTPAGVVTIGSHVGPGLTTSASVYQDGVVTTLPSFLKTARTTWAVAATSNYLVVAGGVNDAGEVLSDAEVFDARTLERIAILPLVTPRQGATAMPLSTEQILLWGGRDRNDQPIEGMELFTPPL
jgi:hypothetical protein